MKVFEATGGYLFRSIERRTVYLHIEVAERALGKPLPPGAEMHHVDGNPKNNAPTNLVICPNHEYHMLLHQRGRARDECGNPDYRRCQICKSYGDPRFMRPHGNGFYHRECNRLQSKARRAKTKGNQ